MKSAKNKRRRINVIPSFRERLLIRKDFIKKLYSLHRGRCMLGFFLGTQILNGKSCNLLSESFMESLFKSFNKFSLKVLIFFYSIVDMNMNFFNNKNFFFLSLNFDVITY